MRKALEVQLRLDIPKLNEIAFDLASRHELERILMGLRYLYDRPQLLRQILDLIAQDVNRHRCAKNGAPGLAYCIFRRKLPVIPAESLPPGPVALLTLA